MIYFIINTAIVIVLKQIFIEYNVRFYNVILKKSCRNCCDDKKLQTQFRVLHVI